MSETATITAPAAAPAPMTAEAAAFEAKAIWTDGHPLHKAYLTEGHPGHKEAVAQVARWRALAAGGTAPSGSGGGMPQGAGDPSKASETASAAAALVPHLVVPSDHLAAMVPADEVEATATGIREVAAKVGMTQDMLDAAVREAATFRAMDPVAQAMDLPRQIATLRGAWGASFDDRAARVSAFLDETGTRAFADEAGMTSTALGMAKLYALASRRGA